MSLEGEIRIPSGAVAGILNRSGRSFDGHSIISCIANMHQSNGLGGGFAAYGIYPEYPGTMPCIL